MTIELIEVIVPADPEVIVALETGPQGPEGDPGPSGGSLLAAFWNYNSGTSSPPGTGQMRTDAGLTQLYVNETDADGFLRAVGLSLVEEGTRVFVRAANKTTAQWIITGLPVDNGTWWTFPITVEAGSGTVTKNARTQLNFLAEPPTGITVVTHDTDPNVARPDSPLVYWVGTAIPTNALVYDFWAAI